MAEIVRRTKRCPFDLTDGERERIKPLLPESPGHGRKPPVDLWEIFNVINHLTRSAGGWLMLPKDFPPGQTVYRWLRRFVRLRLLRTVHDIALTIDRERGSREISPSVAILDRQTVKALATRIRGCDTNKKIAAASGALPSTRTAAC